jgi:phosphohistidine phosphatase SixA
MKASAVRPSRPMLPILPEILMTMSMAVLIAILLTGCATPSQPATSPATFVVVRHAEKVDDSRDPPLAPAGAVRAQRLAAALHDEAVVAVYATPYQRTQQTAAAIAGDHRLAVVAYPANQPADALAAQLRSSHPSGTVLVVGHSNTAPGIAAALCRCAATPLGDNDYSRMYRIHIAADGSAVLQESILP